MVCARANVPNSVTAAKMFRRKAVMAHEASPLRRFWRWLCGARAIVSRVLKRGTVYFIETPM